MMGQFLLLMVFLEKFWFTPVGKVLDERDALIRSKLGSVKDNTTDVDKFAAEAQAILKVRMRGAAILRRREAAAPAGERQRQKQRQQQQQGVQGPCRGAGPGPHLRPARTCAPQAARADVTASINSQKTSKQAELDKQYNDAKAKIAREVDASVAALETESKALLTKLDSQVEKISSEVLRRVLPESVRI